LAIKIESKIMNRYPKPSNGHGSLLDIQILVNDFPVLLTNNIRSAIDISSNSIDWVSPRRDDDFAEYRDNGFLDKLGVPSLKTSLDEFWPKKGPQWDALGRGNKPEYFLLEAKANVREIVSPPTSASDKSLRLIRKSLDSCKEFLKTKNQADWAGTFYQYTNRLTHLYFMRIVNRLPAFLVFVYFIGDKSVSGPESIAEWKAALTVLEGSLGLSSHKLKKYVADVFIDVKEIGL
jgi:hypothetical protein